MKRVVSFILALVMLLGQVLIRPNTAKAAENTDIKAAVTGAYEELKATLNPGESAYDGTFQLLSHALFGNGEELIMDEDDYFSGLAFGSNMFREGFIEGLTAAFERLTNNYDEEMLVSGSYQFYEHKMSYSYSTVSFFMDVGLDSEPDGPTNNGLERLKYDSDWTGTLNSGDEALILVAGGCLTNYTITKTAVSDDSANYHVDIVFRDNFDFGSGNYQSSDAQLAKALTWIGKLMQFGAVVEPYHWEVQLEFDISFDNSCPHETENFRWEFDGTDIVAVTGEGLGASNTTRIQTTDSETGELQDPYFKLDKTVRLNHARPWVLEFRWSGSKISFSPSTTWTDCQPYLLRAANHVYGSEGFAYEEFDPEQNKEVTVRGEDLYTVPGDIEKMGYKRAELHTYRLENRVAADGSNMVYLLIDGDDLGPMNYNYVWKGQTIDMQQTGDWFNGTDFEINYIHNAHYRMVPYEKLEYIQIWENGDSNAPHSFYYTETVTPTCTGKGYTAHICSQCGDTWKDNYVDALGHSFGAFVKKDDTLHSRVCSVCGTEEVDTHSWDAGVTSGNQVKYTCTVCGGTKTEGLVDARMVGDWETDFVFAAADLGVNAPDSVLRCRLSFREDGTVGTEWTAVDLSAIREYFHMVFVNAYYACAYGSGITSFEEVERLCVESTGMGVSDYMYAFLDSYDMKALFTPAPAEGQYMTNGDKTELYLDLMLMDIPSDPDVANPYKIEGNTMEIQTVSYGQPQYTMDCRRIG